MMISLFPPTFVRPWKPGANAGNNPVRIWIAEHVAQSEYWGAVLAQERYEWGFKWLVGILPSIFMERWIEPMGHAVEARVAADYYGADFASYEAREAQSLGSYSSFRGHSQSELLGLMVARRARAARWVKRHHRYILWAVEKGREVQARQP